MDNKDAKKYKKDFPIFENNNGLIYLDNAATSQRPKSVIKAVSDYSENTNANVNRGLYDLSEKAMQLYSEARKTVANFINAGEKEIIFTKNTTESLNLLAYTIGALIPKDRDEIVITEMEHHSNLIPWQQLARRRKMKLKIIKMKPDFTLDLNDAKLKITSKTAIVAFPHVSNILGTINLVEALVDIAKQYGAFSIIDAAQSAPHIKINVKNIGCDFLAFSSHKMLGPAGIGILYGKKELLERLPPFNVGGGMVKKVTWGTAEWEEIPEKFEAGTQNIAEAIGLAESIKYLEKVGFKHIEYWEKQLLGQAMDELQYVEGISIYNPGLDKSVGILSFSIKDVHPHDMATMLNTEGIAVRAGHNCAMPLMTELGLPGGVTRASFYFYNTIEDVEKFVNAVKKVAKKFKK